MHRSLALLALALAAATSAAPALAQAASERASSGPLGTVSMPREATPDADGAAMLTARVHVNASAAAAAGARHLLLGVGNDAAASLAVTIESVTTAAGAPVSPETSEGQGTFRAQWWLNPATLGTEVDLVLAATARPGASAVDVETLVMAFDAGYRALNASDGRPLTIQTFTTVAAAPTSTPPPPTPDPSANDTDDPPPLANDTPPEESQPEDDNGIPASGVVAAAASLALAAIAVTKRRRA